MAMHHVQDCGKDNLTDDEQEANKPLEQEHTISGSTVTRYRRLLHRCCASLDLENVFRKISISHNIQPELCPECKAEKCRCPAFMPGMPFSSASSMPIDIEIDEEQIPQLVENTMLQVLHPPVQLPSDEEANWEVAAICSAPVYYRVRSRNTRRHQYYMYNALDYIEENDRGKQRCHDSPQVQGHPVE